MKLFLVDDDEPSLVFLTQQLSHGQQREVKSFRTGGEALRAFKKQAPDVVISDWYLRGDMLGSELAQGILKEHPKAKIIFMSGVVSELMMKEVRALGGFPVIEKGRDLMEAAQSLDQMLSEQKINSIKVAG